MLIFSVSFAILISALCSVFEAVLYSLSPPQVELMAEKHPAKAKEMHQLKENVERPITAILTLNTIANTIGASVAGAAAVAVFGQHSLVWFSLSFTLAILLFSEILPKTIGVVYSRQLAPFIVAPLQVMITLLRPIIWLCRAVTRLVPNNNQSQLISAAELQTIASLSRKSGQIEADQETVIANILQLDQKSVRKVMTPRTVTFSVEQSLTISQASQEEEKWRMHSRVPLYDTDQDNVVGLVLSQDVLMAAALDQDELELSRLMRPVHFVPETASLDRVFIDFFENHQHLMVVVDEYGSVTGVLSLEDIIEEILGREIVDESDKNRSMREFARLKKKKLPSRELGDENHP
ncbi:hemolysin family protein [Desulfogranum mediterraneum]|uniref:hemolysin family protein n=1 Tax=Desulfogranum mediterraneum TaxID=160661 RepID=UPI001E5FD683|nr:hemolysin family protein [Desulfogranum mediterraneum]